MSTKLFAINNWLFTHRTQIQIALVVVMVSATVLALLATGTPTLADAIGGGGH